MVAKLEHRYICVPSLNNSKRLNAVTLLFVNCKSLLITYDDLIVWLHQLKIDWAHLSFSDACNIFLCWNVAVIMPTDHLERFRVITVKKYSIFDIDYFNRTFLRQNINFPFCWKVFLSGKYLFIFEYAVMQDCHRAVRYAKNLDGGTVLHPNKIMVVIIVSRSRLQGQKLVEFELLLI